MLDLAFDGACEQCVWTCAVSNACDLEQVTLSTLGRTLTDSHSPPALNI